MRTRRLVAAVLLAAGAAWGCSEPAAGPETLRESPRSGGVLRLVQEAPASLDPLRSQSVYESLPVNQIFDTLVRIDASLTVRPALAETWIITPDGREYSFRLRDGVRFHDGHVLSAADVVYSIWRQLRPDPPGPSLAFSYLMAIAGARAFADGEAASVAGLEAVDDRTVRIRLDRPSPSFLEVLAMDNLAIVNEEQVRRLGPHEFGRHPSGTGPFRLVRWDADRLVLEAYDQHYAGRPHLDALEVHFLGANENDFGTGRFLGGAIDVLEPPVDALDALTKAEGVRLSRYQELSVSFLGFNARQPPLDEEWMRRAVAHAIDRDALVGDSPLRRGAAGIVPPGMTGYSPEPKVPEFDPDEARRLLAEAGHPGGLGLPRLRVYSASQGPAAQRLAEHMRADLAAVGIDLEVVPVSWTELGRALDDGTAQAFLLGWVADLTDPESFLRSLFEAGGSGNYFGYADPETERLLAIGASERNPVARARLHRELERHVLHAAPLVPLYHTVGAVAVRDRVEGLAPSPLGLARVEYEHVWLREGDGRS